MMKAEQRIRLMIWIIIALGILNLSTIGTIIYKTQANKDLESDQIQLEINSVMMSGLHFKQYLDLSPQQMDEFRGSNQTFRQKARDINFNLDKLRIQMFNELQREFPDTVKCDRISAEVGQLHEELKIITCRFYLELKQICTPKQEERLKELFEPVFGTSVGFGYGRGGGRYRRGLNME